MIYQLIIKKERIFNNDFNIFSEQIKDMDDGIYSMMRDEKLTINFGVEWLNKIKDLVTINREEFSTIPTEKRVEVLQNLLESKTKGLRELKQKVDEKHASLIDDIDKQIQYYREELKRINAELEKEKNPLKRPWKDWKKGRIAKKSASIPQTGT